MIDDRKEVTLDEMAERLSVERHARPHVAIFKERDNAAKAYRSRLERALLLEEDSKSARALPAPSCSAPGRLDPIAVEYSGGTTGGRGSEFSWPTASRTDITADW